MKHLGYHMNKADKYRYTSNHFFVNIFSSWKIKCLFSYNYWFCVVFVLFV
jgi:hypothetical protein